MAAAALGEAAPLGPLAPLPFCCCCCCCCARRCCCFCRHGAAAAAGAAGVAEGAAAAAPVPPGFDFCSAVAFFHCTQPAARAMPHFSERKQQLTVFVLPRSQAHCHQLHPLHSQQLGSRFGAGLGFFLPDCLPFGCWNAMAAEPWWLSRLAAAAASRGVVCDRPARPRRLRARTRCLRRLSCADLVSSTVFAR